MPEIDGYGLIRQIRGSLVPRVSQVPAIAVTAHANPEDRIRALVAGFQAHVAKPVDAPLLAASIRQLASRRRSAVRAKIAVISRLSRHAGIAALLAAGVIGVGIAWNTRAAAGCRCVRLRQPG